MNRSVDPAIRPGASPSSGAQAEAPRARGRRRPDVNPAVAAFLVCLIIPIQIYIGDIRLPPYRVVLLAFIFPAFFRYLSDPTIRRVPSDWLIILFSLWASASLFYTGASVATVGIFNIETIAPYYIARAYVRNLDQFLSFVRVLFGVVAFSIPFALYEVLTKDPIMLTLLGKVFTVLPNVPHEQRFGLDRAQFTFDHPILYGMFCSLAFTVVLYCKDLLQDRWSKLASAVVGFAAFLSLSSGALVCVAFQVALIGWDTVMAKLRSRWTLLLVSGGVIYFLLEVASNRTVPQLIIPFIALNPGTAWTRLSVNSAALDVIYAHPFFGYGLAPWQPPWPVPTGSIDNFWMVMGFRHGAPAFLFIALATLSTVITLARAKVADARIAICRRAVAITIGAFSIAIVTVHLWDAIYCTFIFMLGVGLWVSSPDNAPSPDDAPGEAKPAGDSRLQRARAASASQERARPVFSQDYDRKKEKGS